MLAICVCPAIRGTLPRMRIKTTLQTLLVSLAVLGGGAATAQAQNTGGGSNIGVGVEQMFTGVGPAPGGLTLVYDPGPWHIDAMLGLLSQNGSQLSLAGRFMFVVHRSSAADFSLGGGLGLIRDGRGPGDDRNNFHLEGIAQIRVFLASNVALSTAVGLGVGIVDGGDDLFAVGGQYLGSMGLVYFFR